MDGAQYVDGGSTTRGAAEWTVRYDEGRNHRARLGFVLIPNEETLEQDVSSRLPKGVGAYFSRAVMPREITIDSFRELRGSLADTAARIAPDSNIDVVSFGCTSGTVAVGEDAVIAELERGAPGAKATTMAGAVRKALAALDARRIVLGTPYLPELNARMASYLQTAGFEVAAAHGFGLRYDSEIVRVCPEFLLEFAAAIDTPDADAILISCGALRTIDIVEHAERVLGKPVICSNQAVLWDALRLAGVDDVVHGCGRLLRDR